MISKKRASFDKVIKGLSTLPGATLFACFALEVADQPTTNEVRSMYIQAASTTLSRAYLYEVRPALCSKQHTFWAIITLV